MAQQLDEYGNPIQSETPKAPINPAQPTLPANLPAGPDWGNIEQQLKDRGGNIYDKTDLEGMKRNASYTNPDGSPKASIDSILQSQFDIYDKRRAPTTSNGISGGDTVSQPQQPPMQSWLGTSSGNDYLKQQTDLMKQMYDRQLNQDQTNKARGDSLYNTLSQRAGQGLDVNAQDPIIANQVNSYRAEQQRGARNSIDAMAEANGPLANINGERRMAMEGAAQNTGSMQAQLIGRELQSRRDEIAQALSGMGGMLSDDQQLKLQTQLGLLDQAIKGQSLSLQDKLGTGGLNNDLLRMMLQNQQFNSGLNSENDQFAATYGLNTADRASYWDAVRRGLV